MVTCSECGRAIPAERLEAVPGTTTCVEHSGTHRRIGYMVGTAAKGCAATLMVVPDDKEAIRQARRAFMRSR
jgi:hypothetical protein